MATRIANINDEYDELSAFYEKHWPHDMFIEPLNMQISEGTIIFRCDTPDRLSGIAVATLIDDRPEELFLSTLLVDPKLRRSGVGSEILSDLLEHVDGLGKSITLKVDDRKTGIIELYKQFGFAAQSVTNGCYLNMERPAPVIA